MWLLLAGCGSPPRRPVIIDARAWGGGEGLTLVFSGVVEGTLTLPGATAESLGRSERGLLREPCPGDAVRWRRTHRGGEEGAALVTACGAASTLTWRGEPVRDLSLELGDGGVWLDLGTSAGVLHAEAPLDRPVGLAGTQHSAVDWECCGAEKQRVGEGAVDVRWSFDRAVTRDWSWER